MWLVELAPLSDPDLVPQAVASALGVQETPADPIVETLATISLQGRVLLVLDNCEHLIDASAALTEDCGGVPASRYWPRAAWISREQGDLTELR